MKTIEDKKMTVVDVLQALTRHVNRKINKLKDAKSASVVKQLQGEIELFESAIFYISH